MTIRIPELALVVLIGPSGSGKSTFARQHFLQTEVLSSDYCRGLVSDDENNQAATGDAFDVLHYIASKRLAAGRLTVIDATNVQPESRRPLVELARQYHCLPVALVFDLPERLCQDRNRQRPDRDFGPHVIRNQKTQLRRGLRGLQREGFRHIHTFTSEEEVGGVTIAREPLYNNRKQEHGPFDIIGDIHGCFDELVRLLGELGFLVEEKGDRPLRWHVTPPPGRKAIFLGDLVDRGPRVPDVLKLAMSMTQAGTALCVPGNHDIKLMRKLRGKDVQVRHGLAESLQQLEAEPPEFRAEVEKFLDSLVSHYVLDDGKLVVAHAGMREEMQGRGSGRVREFALYGETTGETDEFGLPIRYNWAAEYRGRAMVVYGHTPVPRPEWLNRTINIDTGCVFGGALTALRYPEKELVSVPAECEYAVSLRPLVAVPATAHTASAQQEHDDLLDLNDVVGKRLVETRLMSKVTVREGHAAAALEVMSRFAVDPRWLIYLPPTMSPSETSEVPGLLEHPAEAFDYFRRNGVSEVVCEEKHMGSRTVVVICRDAAVAAERFGITTGEQGCIYTRTGRRFFNDGALEQELLSKLTEALTANMFWEEMKTDWACFDCELMPWSTKAQELIRQHYAAVGASARQALGKAMEVLTQAQTRTDGMEGAETIEKLLERTSTRQTNADLFTDAYRRYCWEVSSVEDLRLAPFHLLATEAALHTDKSHLWHMETIGRYCIASSNDSQVLFQTRYRLVNLENPAAVDEAIGWWEVLTGQGGEGMVVKPLQYISPGKKGLAQPALKCRGKEYLRLIYGPDYDIPHHLERLRQRGLSAKRQLAIREFALGIEGLERFINREPLRRVHECTFAVLALESEPLDPRL